ncbi:N-acetylmuramoyl-L-alanine amidase [Mariniphaga anaerophila]|nr:N-acetylmuramoyl-L-alanine amidase [Mariniphaga anaerophila]
MKKRKKYTWLLLLFTSYWILGSIAAHAKPGGPGSTIKTVVIDPGHGGKDSGAAYGNAKEKDIVLDIALKLGNYIQASFPDVNVIYTRNRDVFVPLYRRAAIANKNSADLFISIHVNAVARGVVQGTETYILGQHRTEDNLEVAKKENAVILLEDDYHTTYEGFDPNSSESYIMFELVQDEYMEQSAMLASAVQDQFRIHAKRIDRSVKQAGFLVLRQTTMPSVLIETGFLNHPAERQFLQSKSGQEHLASAIFKAFKEYKKKVEARSSFNMVTETSGRNSPISNNSPDNNVETTSQNSTNIYFSVQIASLSNNVEPSAKNFKGEHNVFMQKKGKTYRYFCGRFNDVQQAREEQKRLKKKYSGAFVVAFENDNLVPVETVVRKL